MMKNNGRLVILTSLICLLPMLFSLAVYGDLPAQMPVHWNYAGQVDGYAHKAVSAFGMPLFFAVMNIVMQIALCFDPKRRNHTKTITTITVWIMPVMSLLLVPAILLSGLGWDIPMHKVAPMLVGILLIVIGNYLPKIRQNYTMGIKLPWTLDNAENWNKTHRLAGSIWVMCGAIMIALSLLAGNAQNLALYGIIGVLLIGVLIPSVYSFLLYRKMEQAGQRDDSRESGE